MSGRGYYQAKGEPARELLPGDVVEIGPGVVHWHGAAPDSWFSHLAVETNPQTNRNTWLEPVDDAQYAAATAPAAAIGSAAGRRGAPQPVRNLFSGDASGLGATDPELIEIFDNFAFGEVARLRRPRYPYADDVHPRIVYRRAGAGRVPDDGSQGRSTPA